MGITISDADVQKRLDQIKQQYFGGSETKYQAQLKKQQLTDAEVREDVRQQLISEAVFAKVTKNVKVSDQDVHAYYHAHQSLYTQPQSRDVRYILVKSQGDREHGLRAAEERQRPDVVHAREEVREGCERTEAAARRRSRRARPCRSSTRPPSRAPTKVVTRPFYDLTQYKSWFVIEPLAPVKPRSVDAREAGGAHDQAAAAPDRTRTRR